MKLLQDRFIVKDTNKQKISSEAQFKYFSESHLLLERFHILKDFEAHFMSHYASLRRGSLDGGQSISKLSLACCCISIMLILPHLACAALLLIRLPPVLIHPWIQRLGRMRTIAILGGILFLQRSHYTGIQLMPSFDLLNSEPGHRGQIRSYA
jgi:hypothetical protein